MVLAMCIIPAGEELFFGEYYLIEVCGHVGFQQNLVMAYHLNDEDLKESNFTNSAMLQGSLGRPSNANAWADNNGIGDSLRKRGGIQTTQQRFEILWRKDQFLAAMFKAAERRKVVR